MNILYFAALNENDETKTGIKNKIYGQCKAMEQLGHEVWLARFRGTVFTVTKSEEWTLEYQVGKGSTRKRCSKAFHILKMFIKDWDIKVLYIRLPSMCQSTFQFLKYLHKQDIKIMMELYTYPLNKERILSAIYLFKKAKLRSAVISLLSLLLDNLYYPFLKTVIDRLVVLLPKDKIWGIKTITIQNGIDTDSIRSRAFHPIKEKIIILGVAYLSYWHGYDRIIKGLNSYYRDSDSEKKRVEFIIVGDGECRKELEEYVINNHMEQWVHFAGIKTGPELDVYYDMADVGVAALGVHRKNTPIVSTLKSREYFAKGLPFLDSAIDYVISDSVSKYCYKVPNDDSEINIEEVICFAEKYKYSDEAHTVMREYASIFLDWKCQMSIVLDCCQKL